jgi:putative membrane protein
MKLNLAIFLIVSSHIAGIIGIGLPIHPDFVRLTPFNLLLSTVIVLSFHRLKTWKFWYFLGIAFLVGFGIEVIGVNTGAIFGHYQYDYVFGYKVFGTPLLIGVNWLLIAYCCGTAADWFLPKSPQVVVAMVGAACMTGMDMLVEPVAMRYGFWSWKGDVVPIQNYIAWFTTSFVLQSLFVRWRIPQRNGLALLLLASQIIFFIVLNLVLISRN